jgi:hypothetical protein
MTQINLSFPATGGFTLSAVGVQGPPGSGGGGGGVTDGDKGDITVSGSGTVWTIDNGAVTLAKQADMATASLIYRKTAGSGAPEVNTLATLKTDLGLTGTNSGDQTITLTGMVTGSGTGSFAASLGSFTKAQLDAAVSDGNVLYVGDVTSNATHTGDATGATALTLATVNSNVGAFGSATQVATFTVNAKGLTTAAGATTIAIPASQITDFATAVAATAAVTANTAKVTNATHTGDVTGATALTIAANAVTNAKRAQLATARIRGRVTAGTGDTEDLTGTQATTLLDTFTTSLKGLAPASGGGTTNFLRADGTWAAPSGGGGGSGDVVGPASATDNALARFDTTTGKLIQNSSATLDDSGVLTIPEAAIPAAPAAGSMSIFARKLAGRLLPASIGPSGLDTRLQPHLGGNRILQVTPTSGTTAPVAIGGNVGVAGTASFQQTFGSTNRWLSTARKRYTSTTTAGNAVSTRQAYLNWMRGSAAGFGGFFFQAQVGMSINLNGSQCFVGLCPATGALGGDPSTDFPLNMCGMGWDAADASTGNWQFFRNDGAGGVVKLDLGATHAARAVNVGWELAMFMAPGGSELFVEITNLNTGGVVLSTSYTTDIPAANTGLAMKCDMRNGAVAAACDIEWAKIYIESDY